MHHSYKGPTRLKIAGENRIAKVSCDRYQANLKEPLRRHWSHNEITNCAHFLTLQVKSAFKLRPRIKDLFVQAICVVLYNNENGWMDAARNKAQGS